MGAQIEVYVTVKVTAIARKGGVAVPVTRQEMVAVWTVDQSKSVVYISALKYAM